MKKILLFTTISFVSSLLNGQTKQELMQGIWADIFNGENKYQEYNYTIKKNNKSLVFGYVEGSEKIDFPLWESIFGFLDYSPVSKGVLNVNNLQDDGEYYITADIKNISNEGMVEYPNFLVPDYFECDGENLSVGGNKLSK